MSTPEGEILAAICDYLELKRYFFYRNNNAPIFDATKKIFRKMPKHTMRGIPDIVVIRDGKYVGLEVKSKTGKQSPFQKDFQQLLEENGGKYAIVTSIDDVMAIGL